MPLHCGPASHSLYGHVTAIGAQHATSRFPTTAWSVVVKAGNPQTQFFHESLARLCNSYWFPVYVFIRRKGFSSEEVRDCTQEFFARLI